MEGTIPEEAIAQFAKGFGVPYLTPAQQDTAALIWLNLRMRFLFELPKKKEGSISQQVANQLHDKIDGIVDALLDFERGLSPKHIARVGVVHDQIDRLSLTIGRLTAFKGAPPKWNTLVALKIAQHLRDFKLPAMPHGRSLSKQSSWKLAVLYAKAARIKDVPSAAALGKAEAKGLSFDLAFAREAAKRTRRLKRGAGW